MPRIMGPTACMERAMDMTAMDMIMIMAIIVDMDIMQSMVCMDTVEMDMIMDIRMACTKKVDIIRDTK